MSLSRSSPLRRNRTTTSPSRRDSVSYAREQHLLSLANLVAQKIILECPLNPIQEISLYLQQQHNGEGRAIRKGGGDGGGGNEDDEDEASLLLLHRLLQDPTAKKKIRSYLIHHRIALVLEAWVDEVMQVRPADPRAYSIKYFQNLIPMSDRRQGEALPPLPLRGEPSPYRERRLPHHHQQQQLAPRKAGNMNAVLSVIARVEKDNNANAIRGVSDTVQASENRTPFGEESPKPEEVEEVQGGRIQSYLDGLGLGRNVLTTPPFPPTIIPQESTGAPTSRRSSTIAPSTDENSAPLEPSQDPPVSPQKDGETSNEGSRKRSASLSKSPSPSISPQLLEQQVGETSDHVDVEPFSEAPLPLTATSATTTAPSQQYTPPESALPFRSGRTGTPPPPILTVLVLYHSIYGHALDLGRSVVEQYPLLPTQPGGANGGSRLGVGGVRPVRAKIRQIPDDLSTEQRRKIHSTVIPTEEGGRSPPRSPPRPPMDFRSNSGLPSSSSHHSASSSTVHEGSLLQTDARHYEWATIEDIASADGIILAFPVKFGVPPGPVLHMAEGMASYDRAHHTHRPPLLQGKPFGVVLSTATQHGGQEGCGRFMLSLALQLGGLYVGATSFSRAEGPGRAGGSDTSKTNGKVTEEEVVCGGSPFGPTTTAGERNERHVSSKERAGAREFGAQFGEVVQRLNTA